MARRKVDWNRWHRLVSESILAFGMDATLAICEKCNIRHMSFTLDDVHHEHVTAQTLYRELTDGAEYLLNWALSGYDKAPESGKKTDWNCYRDDMDTPTLAINLCHEDPPGDDPYSDPLNAIFSPEIQMKLYVGRTKEKDNLVICFIPASQDY